MKPRSAGALCCALAALAASAACAHTDGVWVAYPGVAFYPPSPDPLDGVERVLVVTAAATPVPQVDAAQSDLLSSEWAARLCSVLEGSGRSCSVVPAVPAPPQADGVALLELQVTVSPLFDQTSPAFTHVECERFEQLPVHVEGVFQGYRQGGCVMPGEERELPRRTVKGREGRGVLRLLLAGRVLREQEVRCSPLLAGVPPEFSGQPPDELLAGILPVRSPAPAEYFLVDPRQPDLAAGVAAFAGGDLDGAAARFRAASGSTTTALAAAGFANLGQLRCWRGRKRRRSPSSRRPSRGSAVAARGRPRAAPPASGCAPCASRAARRGSSLPPRKRRSYSGTFT